MAKHAKEQEFIPFLVKLSSIDKHILDEMSSSLDISGADVIRLSLWNYVNVPKDGLLKVTLKELARSREMSFKIDILKELEHINHRLGYFTEKFRNTVDDYHKKHVPADVARRFVTIKLVGLYSLFTQSSQRKEFVNYIRKHFLYYYPHERKWLDKQIITIKNLKKGEKDKLLINIRKELPNDKGTMLEMQEMDGSAGMRGHKADAVPFVPAKRAENKDDKTQGQE